jgi:hypothetical protein
MIKHYCFCPADDGRLYVETPTYKNLLTLLLQQKWRGTAHLRTQHGYVPYSGGGIAFKAINLFLRGVKPLWFLKKDGNYEIASDQLIAAGIYEDGWETETFYEDQYIKECEWKGPTGLRFSMDDIDYIWIGRPTQKTHNVSKILRELSELFPGLPVSLETPSIADNPCIELC